eukprot:6191948-Pleurochrysis_carterae.AAC.1
MQQEKPTRSLSSTHCRANAAKHLVAAHRRHFTKPRRVTCNTYATAAPMTTMHQLSANTLRASALASTDIRDSLCAQTHCTIKADGVSMSCLVRACCVEHTYTADQTCLWCSKSKQSAS